VTSGEWPPRDELEAVAAWAARNHFTQLLSYEDRWEAAWDGVTEAVLQGDDDLPRAALAGISRARNAVSRDHGIPAPDGKTGGRHAAYWLGSSRLYDPLEAVDDRIALQQIWPQLRDRDRRVLTAVTRTSVPEDAAALAGLGWSSYTHSLVAARRHARELWFAPFPAPRRIWGRDDRRRQPGSWRRSAAHVRWRKRKEAS
jgi:hypothetical protein